MLNLGLGLLLESMRALSHKQYRGYSPILITGYVATPLLTGKPITGSAFLKVCLSSRTNASPFA
jgi:hypothetical protein